MQKRERLYNVEFVRAVCAIGIVCFHFACSTSSPIRNVFVEFANGSYGGLFVSVFLILSGAMLYMNNQEIKSLKTFYWKRFKTLFPMFYVAYFTMYALTALNTRMLFYDNASPWTLLLTLVGMDGYLLDYIHNYYILGEWFMGAIVMLYLIYPLVIKAMKKAPKITAIVIFALFFFNIIVNPLKLDWFKSPFTCLVNFYLGMLLMKYKNVLDNLYVQIWGGILAIYLLFVRTPLFTVYSEIVCGLGAFVGLYGLGKAVCKVPFLKFVSIKLGGLSYPMFLVQHIVVTYVLNFRDFESAPKAVGMMAAAIIITVIGAFCLKHVTLGICFVLSKIFIRNKKDAVQTGN